MDAKNGYSEQESLNIPLFVDRIHQLKTLAGPFLNLAWLLRSLHGWKTKELNIILILFNILGLFISRWYHLSVLLCLLAFFAFIGLLHRHTGCLKKVLPQPKCWSCDPDLLQDYTEHTLVIQEYKLVLHEINNVLIHVCDILSSFYDVLKWTDFQRSLRWHLLTGLWLICPILIPFHLMLNVSSIYFLIDKPLWSIFPPDGHDADGNNAGKRTPLVQIIESPISSKTPQGSNHSSDLSDIDDDNADSSVSGNEFSDLEVSLSDEKNAPTTRPPGMVHRLLRRRRFSQNTPETCSMCGVTFTSILKRKRLCNHCGVFVCSHCSRKVVKSILGVTAPVAQGETVYVCSRCYDDLKKGT